MRATVDRDREGRTFADFKDEVIAMIAGDITGDVAAIYVKVYFAVTNSGKSVIGHFEDHYLWVNQSLNTELPEGAILVWTKANGRV